MAQGRPASDEGPSNCVQFTTDSHSNHSHQSQPAVQTYFPQQSGSFSYDGYQYPWLNPWPTNHAQYGPQSNVYHNQPSSAPPQPGIKHEKSTSPSPPPPPAQEYHREWDSVIKSFLLAAGLTQALRGFEADMLILNAQWERENVPNALKDLLKGLSNLGQQTEEQQEERTLDERKLSYVHLRGGIQPRSQTSINKDISMFLAKNRARNNRSNRNEFLESLAEKRQRLNDRDPDSLSSCARADAKPVDRDLQMIYDIAKNEDGPLRKTIKLVKPSLHESKMTTSTTLGDDESLSSNKHPGSDERLKDIETHLAVHYVPSPPRLLLDRIKLLEDHIVELEKDFPPWAALHFNQPNRGWPPPPRSTPIIVPSRMLASLPSEHDHFPSDTEKGKGKGTMSRRGRGSSLHRAVMERLEVQKAKSDLTRGTSMDVDET